MIRCTVLTDILGTKRMCVCGISGGGGGTVECNIACSGRSLRTFRRNLLPPSLAIQSSRSYCKAQLGNELTHYVR
jgi:hypothetical protein